MIAILSSSSRERAALAGLCETQGWVVIECDSIRAFARAQRRSPVRILLIRHKLVDGFCDHVLADLAATGRQGVTRSIVFVAAGSPAALEARQVNLGADCVLRDPIRTDVLLAYLAKYDREMKQPGTHRPIPPTPTAAFAGGRLIRSERQLQHGDRRVALTPREIELIELLVRDANSVVTYDTLYSEILNRRFQGDTSNMRVLLGKLAASGASVGLTVRKWVEVIPKDGYRYRAPPASLATP